MVMSARSCRAAATTAPIELGVSRVMTRARACHDDAPGLLRWGEDGNGWIDGALLFEPAAQAASEAREERDRHHGKRGDEQEVLSDRDRDEAGHHGAAQN